jgi:phage terminase small subunit
MRSLATRDRWLEEICRLAFADVTKLFETDGSLKRFVDMDEDTRRILIGLEVAEIFSGTGDDRQAIGLLKKIKTADKLGALQLLGKAERWLVDRVEHSGKVSLEQLVAGGEVADDA